jgi:tetratricopeptide (TPR) repeat protein
MDDQAIKAYQQVVDSKTEERALLERALYGIGRAHFEQKQYEQAAKAMDELMTKYPKSGLFFESKFILGKSYSELGNAKDAMVAIGDVMRYATDPVLINRAGLDLGAIQKKQGDLAGALASYQRIVLLTDPTDPKLRPMVEEASGAAIDLAIEMKRYKDLQDFCDQYLKLFPNGARVEEVRRIKADTLLKATETAAVPATTPAPAP